MECEGLFTKITEQYETLRQFYLENNELPFCERLTNSYAILTLMERTIEDLKTSHMTVSNPEALHMFTGIISVFNEKLQECRSVKPECRCSNSKKCSGLNCLKAYGMSTQVKMYTMLEKYRVEMFGVKDHRAVIPERISAYN